MPLKTSPVRGGCSSLRGSDIAAKHVVHEVAQIQHPVAPALALELVSVVEGAQDITLKHLHDMKILRGCDLLIEACGEQNSVRFCPRTDLNIFAILHHVRSVRSKATIVIRCTSMAMPYLRIVNDPTIH